jgi:hypothetical protein
MTFHPDPEDFEPPETVTGQPIEFRPSVGDSEQRVRRELHVVVS